MKKKNLIFAIGDGMGLHQLSLGRLHGHQSEDGSYNSELFIDQLNLVSMQDTQSANSTVTDSAAAGTAIATGQRCDNKQIGIQHNGKRVPTIVDDLKDAGYRTIIVTTSRVTHATPAAFYAFNKHRDNEINIAEQFATSKLDGLIGGGQLIKDKGGGEKVPICGKLGGVKFCGSYKDLWNNLPNDPFVAALEAKHLPYEIDRPSGAMSLQDLAEYAFHGLRASNQPYCLIIESARIDHACHAHDAVTTAKEVLHFDMLLRDITAEIDEDQTLLVVTSDHSCGGPAISEKLREGKIDTLRTITKAHRFYADTYSDENLANVSELMNKLGNYIDPPYRSQMREDLTKAFGKHEVRAAIGHWLSKSLGVDHYEIPFLKHINHTYGLTFGHDGTDVPVFANSDLNWKPRIKNSDLKQLILSEVLGQSGK